MPDQSSASTEHALIQEITAPLATLPEDPIPVAAEIEFPMVLRGYDRFAVDAYVKRTTQLVAELQAMRSPEAAIRRALERVGEEVSGVLQRAHEISDQITSQSRSEAENRLEAARKEAVQITAAADRRVKNLDAETDRIWAERQRIVDDAQELARQLLALAEAAAERFPPEEDATNETGGPGLETPPQAEPGATPPTAGPGLRGPGIPSVAGPGESRAFRSPGAPLAFGDDDDMDDEMLAEDAAVADDTAAFEHDDPTPPIGVGGSAAEDDDDVLLAEDAAVGPDAPGDVAEVDPGSLDGVEPVVRVQPPFDFEAPDEARDLTLAAAKVRDSEPAASEEEDDAVGAAGTEEGDAGTPETSGSVEAAGNAEAAGADEEPADGEQAGADEEPADVERTRVMPSTKPRRRGSSKK